MTPGIGKSLSSAASGPIANNTFSACLNYTNLAEYSLQGFLGNGSYAQVRQATHKATNYPVAIKIYDKLKLNENKEVKKSVSREILLLSALSGTARRAPSHSAVSMISSNFSEVNAFETMGEFGRGHPNIMRLFDAIDT